MIKSIIINLWSLKLARNWKNEVKKMKTFIFNEFLHYLCLCHITIDNKVKKNENLFFMF